VKEVAVPTIALPDDPDLGQLRKQAKDVQRALRAGAPEPLALAAELDAPADAKLSPHSSSSPACTGSRAGPRSSDTSG
jgi:hypothetical protein